MIYHFLFVLCIHSDCKPELCSLPPHPQGLRIDKELTDCCVSVVCCAAYHLTVHTLRHCVSSYC